MSKRRAQPDSSLSYAQEEALRSRDIAETIVEQLLKDKNAGELCAAVARWCATSKANCPDDEVWRLALAALGIDTLRKRDEVASASLQFPQGNTLLPRLSARQLFNIICTRLMELRYEATSYSYDRMIKWLTIGKQLGNVTPIQGSVLVLFQFEAPDTALDNERWFWKLYNIANATPIGVSWDVRDIPWHENVPMVTTHNLLDWLWDLPNGAFAGWQDALQWDQGSTAWRELYDIFWVTHFAPAFNFDPQDIYGRMLEGRAILPAVLREHNEWVQSMAAALFRVAFKHFQYQIGNVSYDDYRNYITDRAFPSNIYSYTVTVRKPQHWAFPELQDNDEFKRDWHGVAYSQAYVLGVNLRTRSLPPKFDDARQLLLDSFEPLFAEFVEETLRFDAFNKNWRMWTAKKMREAFVRKRYALYLKDPYVFIGEYPEDYHDTETPKGKWTDEIKGIRTLTGTVIDRVVRKLFAEGLQPVAPQEWDARDTWPSRDPRLT